MFHYASHEGVAQPQCFCASVAKYKCSTKAD